MKSLSLLEEFLLLTLEDEGGEFDQVPEIFVHCGIAGATLMELALQGRIDSDLHGLWVVDPTPTGDDILDKALNAIAAEPEKIGRAHV